jgi:hypothetical protein
MIFRFLMAVATACSISLADRSWGQAPSVPGRDSTEPAKPVADPSKADVSAAITRGVELLLAMQESLDDKDQAKGEWPYEGVYRVNRTIPIGYRVGGTAIAAIALIQAPGYGEDKTRQGAVERALAFVCAQRDHPLMSEKDYDGEYDVRCWGYIYAIQLVCALKKADAVPVALKDDAENAMKWYLSGLLRLEMPQTGGWNYARPAGRDTVGAPSPFMTAPALQALFAAAACGYAVDEKVVERGLATLEKGRAASGAINYAGEAGKRSDLVPGATGRMLAAETTLLLAGRGSVASVRASLDAFLVHWKWLEARRKQQGTHVAPYGVAPYYFMYAHAAAGRAIELLPRAERAEYRKRFCELLFSVRDPDGSWNDRVFKRSANYGTACAMLALMAPDAPELPCWPAKKE